MNAELILSEHIAAIVNTLYGLQTEPQSVVLQKTKKEFEGDLTLVVFPYVKASKAGPEQTAQQIGEALKARCADVHAFNVVKGFLNISFTDAFWLQTLKNMAATKHFGTKAAGSSGKTIMLEYSSPNTNKPLHLGHIRNNLLGYSVSQLLKTQGHHVIKANLVNDRGIHICKSMLAWKKFGNGETPKSSGMKGDHLVGKYYVEFDKAYKREIQELIAAGQSKEEAEKNAPMMKETQDMLRQWEAGDTATIDLWKTMNGWVYEGFTQTYNMLGVDFDKMYYESNTYLLGKELVQDGLAKGVFYKKEDGSVRIDLSKEGLDEKVVLRSDGTSVYITQDLGTAIERFKEFPELNQLIYTVGNEQDYHFKVLFKILEKLGYAWAKECYHLSYGMVELPEGKMKSREGTVVDADDLIHVMIQTARETTEQLGKTEGLAEHELQHLYITVGLGALKYFILKVDPKKKMLFDPKESIDFNGHTGPFIQYTHARICSILRKAESLFSTFEVNTSLTLHARERELIRSLYEFPAVLSEAANGYNPGLAANYIYELTKLFNQFYHDCPVLKEENEAIRKLRLSLSETTANVIKTGMNTLGIDVPERM
ncbi:MAG: arginine--tRNA ligase [Bacteroidetes bacterium]|nr:arginine--tRNA ligase [Bacteroidota bacterium]